MLSERPQHHLDYLQDQINSKRTLHELMQFAHIHKLSIVDVLQNHINLKNAWRNQNSARHGGEARKK